MSNDVFSYIIVSLFLAKSGPGDWTCSGVLVPFNQLCSSPTHSGPLEVENNGLRGTGNIVVNIPFHCCIYIPK